MTGQLTTWDARSCCRHKFTWLQGKRWRAQAGDSPAAQLLAVGMREAWLSPLHPGSSRQPIGSAWRACLPCLRWFHSAGPALACTATPAALLLCLTWVLTCRRYYICDNKLGTLGWKERTPWEDGLKRTVEWYLKHGFQAFWDNGDVEAALQPHPIIHPQVGSAAMLQLRLGCTCCSALQFQ